MRWGAILGLSLGALMLGATPAQAGGVIAALQVAFAAASAGAGFGAAVAAGFGALGAFTKFAIGIGISLAGQLFAKKPGGIRDAGIQTEQTTTGDVTLLKFPVGFYGLEGHAVAPAYSRDNTNNVLTYILEVSNIPGVRLTGRIAIDGQWAEILDRAPLGRSGVDGAKALDGFLEEGKADHAWMWFVDGSQTEAHPHLVEHYADHPDRPWTTDHVLRGTAYAILEFQRDPDFFSGLPAVLFEVEGIALYDPRKDSSVGGTGAHRHHDPATWEPSRNPQVISYNVYRGIPLPNGDVYGGEVPAEDLPLDSWFAAMNECDRLIGDRVQYEAGFEVNTGEMEPADVIDEMNRASFAQPSEFGGVFRVRVGAPAVPVMAVNDADFMISESAVDDLFPTLDQTFNAGSGNYNDPGAVWQARALETVLNGGFEAEDGGRRLPQNIGLPAVFDNNQGQHLLESYVKDSRRFRVHTMTLPPSFSLVEPLDTISYTSARNGYDEKLFEVLDVEDRPGTLQQRVTVREREPGDVDWTPAQDLPAPVAHNGLTQPLLVIPLITLAPFAVLDSNGVSRRAALRLSWLGDIPADAASVQYELRLAPGGDIVASGLAESEAGSVELHDVLPNTAYEARARYVIAAPRAWSGWVSASTADIRLTAQDISDALNDQVNTAFDATNALLGEDGVPQSVADLLAHVRAGLGDGLLPTLPGQPGAPLVPPPPDGPVDVRIERAERAIDIELPRGIERDRSIDQLAEALTATLLKAERLESLVADAGIFVEPESGRVRIEATGLSGEAQLLVDGLNAQITQRVTFADMDQAIAGANFDPSQIADLDNLFFRLSTAETTLDAQSGSITDLTETLTVDGGVVTMTTVTGRLDSLEGEIVNKVDVTVVDDLQTQVNSVEQTLSGIDGARLETVLTSSAAAAQDLDDLAELTLAQLLDAHRGDKAAREGVALARQDMWARADAIDEAVAGLRLDLGVSFKDARALIQQEAFVRASETVALGETVDQIAVELDDQADEISGVAAAIDDTSARVTATEDGLDIVSRSTRANTAGIGLALEDAASVDLRALLDDHETRKALRLGTSQVRSDTQALVEEGRLALARTRDELTASLGDTDARLTQTSTALATETEARVEQFTQLDGRVGDVEGLATDIINLDLAPDSLLAERFSGLDGRVGDVEGLAADIVNLDLAPDSLLAERFSGLDGRVGDVEGLAADIVNLDLAPASALASQIRLQEVSLGSANLVRNGDLRTGDLTGWQAVSPLMSVITRGPSGSGVIDNAPTPHMLRIDAGAFASALLSADEPIRPGEQLELGFSAAILGTGSEDYTLRFEWLDGGGAVIGTNLQTLTVSGNFWRRSDFAPITPLAGAEMFRVFLRRAASGLTAVIADISVTRLTDAVTDARARIETVEATRVTEAGAVSAVNQEISASYGDLEALAEATSFAEATADGIAAGYVWRLNGQNVLEAVSVQDGVDTGPTSTFKIAADFVQITGIAQIDTAVITDLVSETAFVENLTVTNANLSGPIQSDNFVDGAAGWRITRAGGAQFNGPVISRNIVAAEGDFDPGILGQIASDGPNILAEFDLIPTGIFLPVDQVWMPSDAAYLAYAAFDGEATSPGFTDKDDVFWGVTAELRPFARWNGPQQLYLKATVWARNQVTLHAQGDAASSGRIFWTIYKVT